MTDPKPPLDLAQFEGHTFAHLVRRGLRGQWLHTALGDSSASGDSIAHVHAAEPWGALLAAAPALLDEVRRLRAEVERMKAACAMALPHHMGGHSEVGAALRSALGELPNLVDAVGFTERVRGLKAEVATERARAEKAEAERDAATAAVAAMREALEKCARRAAGDLPEIENPAGNRLQNIFSVATNLLHRTTIGAGWRSPEAVAAMVAEKDAEIARLTAANRRLFRAVELGGEIGELLNVVKKMEREAMGVAGSRATTQQLDDELGDALICTSLLAIEYDRDLSAATVRKFNTTSEKVGLQERLPEGPLTVGDLGAANDRRQAEWWATADAARLRAKCGEGS